MADGRTKPADKCDLTSVKLVVLVIQRRDNCCLTVVLVTGHWHSTNTLPVEIQLQLLAGQFQNSATSHKLIILLTIFSQNNGFYIMDIYKTLCYIFGYLITFQFSQFYV